MYDLTPYHFSYNSPLFFSDPTGLCPDCPDPSNSKEGDTTIINGTTYIFNGTEWDMQQNLDEITLVGSSKKPEGPQTEEEAKASQESEEPFMLHWGFQIWGAGSSDRLGSFDRASGAESISVDYRDIPPMGNDSNLWGQKIWDWVNYLAFWNDRGSKDSDENRSENNQSQIVDSITNKVKIIDIRINYNCIECGTRITNTKDTTIINSNEAIQSLKKYNDDIRSKASIEWRRQLDSLRQLDKYK